MSDTDLAMACAGGRCYRGDTMKLSKKLKAHAARMRGLVHEALASDAATEAGAAVYRAEDVHAWIEHLAKGAKPARPRPYRR